MNAVHLQLTKGKVTIIDADDFDRLSQWSWSAVECDKRWYAQRMESRRHGPGKRTHKGIMMHRFIIDAPKGMQVDHINGDSLDNRKANLRLVTAAQNQQNRKTSIGLSKYKGVSPTANRRKWTAALTFNRKRVYIGMFDTEEQAARAYDAKARELFGEYAAPNFPTPEESNGQAA